MHDVVSVVNALQLELYFTDLHFLVKSMKANKWLNRNTTAI